MVTIEITYQTMDGSEHYSVPRTTMLEKVFKYLVFALSGRLKREKLNIREKIKFKIIVELKIVQEKTQRELNSLIDNVTNS